MSVNVRYTWTQDLRLFLANCVRKRQRLWKKGSVLNNDMEVRQSLWTEVVQEIFHNFKIRVEIDECKKAWKNLKDNYVRVIKFLDVDPAKAEKWFFFKHLRFLDEVYLIQQEINNFTMDSLNPDNFVIPARKHRIPVVSESTARRRKLPLVQIGFPKLLKLMKTSQTMPENAQIEEVNEDNADFVRIVDDQYGCVLDMCEPGTCEPYVREQPARANVITMDQLVSAEDIKEEITPFPIMKRGRGRPPKPRLSQPPSLVSINNHNSHTDSSAIDMTTKKNSMSPMAFDKEESVEHDMTLYASSQTVN